jgi:hypothetical protein
MILEIDENQMRGVMMAALVRRLKDRGWSKENAERIANKAIEKATKRATPMMAALSEELSAAYAAGASEMTLRLLVTAAYAVAGVDVADDLTRTSIAERN